jgi:hypothetical protein
MPRYVGNLHEKGNPSSNLGSFSIEAPSQEIAIADLSRQALGEMERSAKATASLAMTEDGRGIGTIELESPKHAHRP